MRASKIPSTHRSPPPRTALRSLRLPLAMLWLWSPWALAQSDLGQVLDAGGKRLTLEEFKQELVQRSLIGPTPTGGSLELMYTRSGRIQGVGSPPGTAVLMFRPYNGTWAEGENESVCSTLLVMAGTGSTGLTLPRRCQFWFKVGERYYLSDSDSDRSAKVLLRTVKP
jgi:hypothetical protein